MAICRGESGKVAAPKNSKIKYSELQTTKEEHAKGYEKSRGRMGLFS